MTSSFREIINADKPVLVDFYAEWCGPCKLVPPILQEVANEMGDKIRIVKIDVDKNKELAASYNVKSVPTLMIFKHGQLLWREAGFMYAKPMVSLLEQYL